MAESSVNVTEGSGKRLHTWDRTISSVLVQDQFTVPGEYPLPGYIVNPTASISVATANDHVLQLMAGSSLRVRIRRIRFEQSGNATTAAALPVSIYRLTTAGTGGTSVTPRPLDPADAAAGATAMTLPTAKGTEGVMLLRTIVLMRQGLATAGSTADDVWIWEQHPGEPPIIIAAGTSNGIAIKSEGAVAGATCIPAIEFVETSF